VNEINTPAIATSGKRSDIQVLRGLAVLAVVFYHLGFPIDGGFLGVDSFFVISGFVITGTLLRSQGTIKRRVFLFYKKRVRRILPTSVYITLVTLFASFLFLPRIYLSKYFLDAVSSIFMVSNIKFAKDGVDYLQQTLHSSPFLHFWSLGVEEQFYLIWPLFLFSLFRQKYIYNIALPALFVGSTITAHFYPTVSFFSPTSRAWEFLAGAFVATLSPCKFNKVIRLLIVLLSFSIVLSSLIFAKHNGNLLHFFTLMVVTGTGLLIYVGFSNAFFKPLVEIGNISYSLYLVHWPIIAIVLFHFERIDKFLAIGSRNAPDKNTPPSRKQQG
jgi:peptidoglycan/LPS O-acetylase OafA/YrhL